MIRQRADFVKEQCAAFRRVKISFSVGIRTRESAFDMTEEHGGCKFRWDGTAVHRDKRLVFSWAVEMNGTGYGLLAGSVGTENQYRYVSGGHKLRQMQRLTRLRAVTLEKPFKRMLYGHGRMYQFLHNFEQSLSYVPAWEDSPARPSLWL